MADWALHCRDTLDSHIRTAAWIGQMHPSVAPRIGNRRGQHLRHPPRPAEDWHEYGDKQCDDRQNDQQFDQRKAAPEIGLDLLGHFAPSPAEMTIPLHLCYPNLINKTTKNCPSACQSRQPDHPALIVMHKGLGIFASMLAAAEFVHQRVNSVKALRVLAFVGHAGRALALFDGCD